MEDHAGPEILAALAKSHFELGQFDDALTLARQATQRREQLEGPDAPSTLESHLLLANILPATGRAQKASELFASRLPTVRAAADPRLLARYLDRLGLLYTQVVQQPEKAEPLHREAVEIHRRLDEPGIDSLIALGNLANVLAWLGRHEESLTIN